MWSPKLGPNKPVPDPASGDNDRPAAGEASLIDRLVRGGARRMLAEALRAEVDA